jgi:isoquinoline 1-oxidoreductase alpha subunit
MATTITVNGRAHPLDGDLEMPLLWYLRDHLGLMGTKYSCGIGECGACTVHVNGEAVLSCVTTLKDVMGKEVITIEGLTGRIADALYEAWLKEDVCQCGYCQPGQIMTAAALLASTSEPTALDVERHMSGVSCRCGSYPRIRRAVMEASRRVGGAGGSHG